MVVDEMGDTMYGHLSMSEGSGVRLDDTAFMTIGEETFEGYQDPMSTFDRAAAGPGVSWLASDETRLAMPVQITNELVVADGARLVVVDGGEIVLEDGMQLRETVTHLYDMLEEKDEQIADLEARLAALEASL
ncbi:MAG: hypothetical protein ACPGQL_09205 [Thermoplasmatota archaeon]